MLTGFVNLFLSLERPFMVHLLTTKRYIVYLTFDRFLSFFIVAGNDILQLNIGSSFFLAGQQIDRLQKSLPERIYNSHYGKMGAGIVYLLVLSSWKVNIAKNPIAVMGL